MYATHAETGSSIVEELVVSMEVDGIEGDTDHTRGSHYVPLKSTAGDGGGGGGGGEQYGVMRELSW